MYAVTITFRNCPNPPDVCNLRPHDGANLDASQLGPVESPFPGNKMLPSRNVLSKPHPGLHTLDSSSQTGNKIYIFCNDPENNSHNRKKICRCWLKSQESTPTTPHLKMNGPSRLLNDEIVNRTAKNEPKWVQRRQREVTYHEQTEGIIPSKSAFNGDKPALSTRKAQVHWMIPVQTEAAPTASVIYSGTGSMTPPGHRHLRKNDSVRDYALLRESLKIPDASATTSPVRKAPLSLEDADVGLNADIFRLPMRSNGGKTVFHVGKTERCGPVVLMRGSRPKSMVTAADSSHLKAGCAANDAVFRTVDAALQHGRKHQRTLSPAFKHSKAAIHVPPRTAHRIKHIVDKTDSVDSGVSGNSFHLSSSHQITANLGSIHGKYVKKTHANKKFQNSRADTDNAATENSQKLSFAIQPRLNKGDFAITELAVDVDDKFRPADFPPPYS